MADNGSARTTFLTVTEVADQLRVSRMTVYRWIHAGDLPAVQFGRSFRVPHAVVEQMIDQAGVTPFAAEGDERRSGTVG